MIYCAYYSNYYHDYLILLKNNTAIVSAMEAQDVGCPDLALLVDSTE